MRLDPRFKDVTQGVTAFFVSSPPVFLFLVFLFFVFGIEFLPKLDIQYGSHMVASDSRATCFLIHFELEKKKRESLSHQPQENIMGFTELGLTQVTCGVVLPVGSWI